MTRDKIAKPAKSRYFPIAYPRLRELADAQGFSSASYHDHIPLHIENCEVECEAGYQLGSFIRMVYLAAFSLPEIVPAKLAAMATERAIEEFAAIDATPHLAVNEQQFVVYRAYLGMPGTLTVTQHIVKAVSRKYLAYDPWSQLSKANRDPRDERVLRRVEFT